MSFSEEWRQLPGQTKMFIIGGGGIALFFLYSSIRNRNSQQTQQQSTTQQTADPSSWIDAQTQQMQAMQQLIGGMNDSIQQYQQANQDANQQNQQALQQIISQNQQATQQQIQALLNNMPKAATYPAAAAPAPSVVAPAPAPAQTSKPTRMGNMNYATPAGGWDPNSVVDFIKAHGGYADFASRKILASQMGIQNYTGTAEQNINMLNNLRSTYA